MGVKIKFGTAVPKCGKPGCTDMLPHIHVAPMIAKAPASKFVAKDGAEHDVHPKNWHLFCKSWEMDQEWWTPHVAAISEGTICQVLIDYTTSTEDSFAKFCSDHLQEIIKNTGPYPAPVYVVAVTQEGQETETLLRVGCYTIPFVEWLVKMLKGPAEKVAMQDEGDILAPHIPMTVAPEDEKWLNEAMSKAEAK
jgi:hypothetical protein